MVAYQYEALKIPNRTRESGIINAPSEREARERLREQDLIPTRLRVIPDEGSGGPFRARLLEAFFQRLLGVGLKEKIAFSRNLGMMVKAGIPMSEALLYLENYIRHGEFRRVLARVRADILAGSSFSQALARHPCVFDDVYVNVIQAGEASGELVASLARMTTLLTKTQRLRMKLVTASVYPAIVLVIVTVVLAIMTFVVLPTFQEIYLRMGVELPWLTRSLIEGSRYVRDYGYLLVPLLAGAGYLAARYFRTDAGKSFFDTRILRVPVVGELVRLVENSNFLSTFSVSFGAGLPITDALALSAQTVRNRPMRTALGEIGNRLQVGQRLGASLSQTGYLPDIVLLMLSSGEESGELDQMLQNAYEFVEEEINHRIDMMTSMMEPVMLTILGIIVGLLALAIYLPMFRLYESL